MLYFLNPLNWTWYLSDLTGLTALGLVGAFTIACYLRYPRLGTILTLAFLIRAVAAVFHFYIRPLPDAGDDAARFERYSWEWSEGGWESVIAHWGDWGAAWTYSYIGSAIYQVIGRSGLLLQSISIAVGIATVVATWKLALRVWGDERLARKAAWVAALFPTLVLYSSVTMREPFIVFLFVCALLWTARWAQSGNVLHALAAFGLFGLQIYLHAGLVVDALALAGYMAWEITSRFFSRFFSSGYVQIIPAIVIGTGVAILSVTWYSLLGMSLPYIGTLAGMLDVAVILRQATNVALEAGSAWPAFLLPTSLPGVIVVTPFRMLYFLFSPFPWDIRAVNHLIGLVDAVLYMIIFAAAWRNRVALWQNKATRVILLMLIPMVLAFAWGTGNAGTAVRHRSKLILAFVMLAGRYLPRIRYGSR